MGSYKENYEKSLIKLKMYLKVMNDVPTEYQWNRYATVEKLLSSKSMEYGYGNYFNKMCKELIRKINIEK